MASQGATAAAQCSGSVLRLGQDSEGRRIRRGYDTSFSRQPGDSADMGHELSGHLLSCCCFTESVPTSNGLDPVGLGPDPKGAHFGPEPVLVVGLGNQRQPAAHGLTGIVGWALPDGQLSLA